MLKINRLEIQLFSKCLEKLTFANRNLKMITWNLL